MPIVPQEDWSFIDKGVQFAVEILNRYGIETFESCQGGEGHCYLEPTIRFHGGHAEGFKGYAIAMEHGLRVYALRRAWSVSDGELTGPHWELVFSPKPGKTPFDEDYIR